MKEYTCPQVDEAELSVLMAKTCQCMPESEGIRERRRRQLAHVLLLGSEVTLAFASLAVASKKAEEAANKTVKSLASIERAMLEQIAAKGKVSAQELSPIGAIRKKPPLNQRVSDLIRKTK